MKLLVIGQIPPPFYGQSINIGKMLEVLKHDEVQYRFVRMNFSDGISEIGSVNSKKIRRLGILWLRICKELIFFRPQYVYYPPAGPDKTPIIRDMLLLFPVRLFSFPLILHYHAGGLAEAGARFSGLLKKLFRFTYYRAAYSICLSDSGKQDPEKLMARHIRVIPTGVEDPGPVQKRALAIKKYSVLFAGVCRESKGIGDFIGVIRICRAAGKNIEGVVIGNIFSAKEQALIEKAVADGTIRYEGVRTGADKARIFKEADLFLFPTYYESENFPTVILESFSFGLPVVSTHWRGISDQVISGENGYLHEVHDIDGMAASVNRLCSEPGLYASLSANARQAYETRYTMEIFSNSIRSFFKSIAR